MMETKLKESLRTFTMAVALAGAALATGLSTGVAAAADAREQFFPVLTYRTGAYAPNGVPFANGYVDYLKYVNPKGGINGVKVTYEECETGYATDKGVECYERLKGKNATVFQPLSTGITFALTEKVANDKIPLITAGYGRSESADGMVFKWNFPLTGTYWDAADVLIQHLGKKEGGLDKLAGKKSLWCITTVPLVKSRFRFFRSAASSTGLNWCCCPLRLQELSRNRPGYKFVKAAQTMFCFGGGGS